MMPGAPLAGAGAGAIWQELAGALVGRPLKASRQHFEAQMIRLALERRQGNITRAAEDLGLERTNLHKKIRQLQEAGEDLTL
jgi:two-component system nitrogen regulation response regulator NtrX